MTLTLASIDRARRPDPSTVCKVCPAAVWMATPRDVKCFCRLMHYWSWETSKPNELTHCDGLAIASEKEELTGGLTADAGAPDWRTIAQRMYAAWEQADATERTRLTRTGADKFMAGGGPFGARQAFGMNRALGGLSGGRMPREFGLESRTRSMAEIGSFDAIASLPFETGPVSDTTGLPFNRRARAATGREADTVRDQFARDLSEARARRGTTGTTGTTGVADERSEFAEIRATLDASRLLAALAHSHGLIVEKYQIGKGRDGADRIKAGSRHLNVSDFLTKEMNLSWADAAQLLRDTYQAQTGRDPAHAPRRTPERDLWAEFQAWRAAYRNALRREWTAQERRE